MLSFGFPLSWEILFQAYRPNPPNGTELGFGSFNQIADDYYVTDQRVDYREFIRIQEICYELVVELEKY